MARMTKKEKKDLAKFVKQMPPTYYEHQQRISGAELIARGITKTPSGELVNPLKTYTYPAKHEVNHKKRMLKLYESGGFDEVVKYVKDVAELTTPMEAPYLTNESCTN